MNYFSKSVSAIYVCVSSFILSPAFGKDELPNTTIEAAAVSATAGEEQKPGNALCEGNSSVAQRIVNAQFRIRSGQEPYAIIAETFNSTRTSDRQDQLAATIAAQAIASMVKHDQIRNQLSLSAAEIFCNTAVIHYRSYLRKNPHHHPTELGLAVTAGAAFDNIFSLLRHGQFLSVNTK